MVEHLILSSTTLKHISSIYIYIEFPFSVGNIFETVAGGKHLPGLPLYMIAFLHIFGGRWPRRARQQDNKQASAQMSVECFVKWVTHGSHEFAKTDLTLLSLSLFLLFTLSHTNIFTLNDFSATQYIHRTIHGWSSVENTRPHIYIFYAHKH